ncbi:YraN family protein [Microbacterium sp. kSW2-24]|jgi:putative endonuclease|uniref:YraN family protein n=1 Tax=Microbacterium TaxID=33882 RepID=UPI001FFD7461|nr:YraN family protein [Microbacterium galbinum]MCK2021887.1 YraN family protein [Microbacterium galbinum]
MAAKDDLGRAGEERAARHLVGAGYTLLDRNWRCAQGEIDIVALQGEDLVFVEVKTRRTIDYGHPFEAIDARKKRRMWGLAHAWAVAHPLHARGRRIRLDVVGIVGHDPSSGSLEHVADLV